MYSSDAEKAVYTSSGLKLGFDLLALMKLMNQVFSASVGRLIKKRTYVSSTNLSVLSTIIRLEGNLTLLEFI
jgi:hypothetical protein